MRVLLIQPSMIVSERWSYKAEPFLPVGLGLIASVLREANHEVKIVDALTEGWEKRWRLEGNWIEIGLAEEDVAAEVREFRPHVVGFSIPLTSQLPRVRSLARWVKAIHPEIFVICGGNHPTAAPRDMLEIPEMDLVVLGESEAVLPQALDRLANNQELDDLAGVAYREIEGGIAINPISDYSEDLDSLPLPAYDLLPLKKYFKITGKRSIPFFTSRGCKNQCAYCTTRQHAGKSVRQFSPQYLLKQIRHLIEYYGVREFFFDDHGLFLDKTYTKSFFKALQESKLKIQWHARNGINPCVLEDDLLDTLKKSGCKRLYFNPDSGSRRILSRCLSKPYNPFVTEQSIQRTLRSGIKVSCQFILGSPGESMDEIYETLNFAWKLRNMGVDQFNFDLAVPYIGTKLRKLAEKKNCLLPYPDQMYTPDDALMSTEQLDAADLIRIRDTAEREFNSRGLVVGLKSRRFNTTKQSAVTEDRIFYSVAPQPYLTSRKLKPALAKNPA